MLSMNLVVLFVVAAVFALSSSAVVDPKANSNAKENLIDDKAVGVNDTYVSDLSDDDDDTDDDKDAEIDGIPIKSLTENELKDLLDEEDNIIVAQLGKYFRIFVQTNVLTCSFTDLLFRFTSSSFNLFNVALVSLSTSLCLVYFCHLQEEEEKKKKKKKRRRRRRRRRERRRRSSRSRRSKNLRNFNKNGISGQTGTVGPHRFTVRDGSKQGSPTLEIRSPKPNGEYVRKFRYEK
ncbi:unnamed protein product [Candidula unifasciata]|uniref:Uncharacterized protein n=1 Tax=Candidula unifasciata TaxID=100452 RepID=A0A8S3ZBA8_9EUPU|nr:unnamed protein product [Candidula unifasciata]